MGLVVIFALVAILAAFSSLRMFKQKNILGILFAVGSFLIFGAFALMTAIKHGVPLQM
ncbi:DUF2759 domain-containing protein [Bacillus testis]|uniref:DUF2759 domain-containing protein n=1 Tax=Bacillus testis TaxID=1622072 RepID=UPI00084102F8|nr:DUF2759 domain-containing protein [Bacillus testis]